MQDDDDKRIERLQQELAEARAIKRRKETASRTLKAAQKDIEKALQNYANQYESLLNDFNWSASTARRKGLMSPMAAYKECKDVLFKTTTDELMVKAHSDASDSVTIDRSVDAQVEHNPHFDSPSNDINRI
jgi:flagellar motor component MotA